MKRFFVGLLAALLICTAACGGGSCNENGGSDGDEAVALISVDGTDLIDENGDKIMLRGVNAGGLGVIEQWMTCFQRSSSQGSEYVARDSYTTSKVWIERFGIDDTLALWDNYQAAWWNETDFANCAEMGINVIRLPFTYMNIDFGAVASYDNAGDFDFTFLDNFVDSAAKYSIYTILDLHGAYGSQNGQDHSGQTFGSAAEVTFYEDERMIGLTANLWGAVAEHFKNNPAVAGYDLLNEPVEKAEGSTGEKHWRAMDRFYDAIRATGDRHVVIFESCWGAEGLPKPAKYGWTNCMYSFHHYTNCSGDDRVDEHKASFSDRMRGVEEANFGVPLYMGEFTCYTNEEQWTYTLDLMNRNGWHWTTWTYKIWGSSGWGVYNIITQNETKIDAHHDDYDAIRRSFRSVRTDTNAAPFTFASGRTLFDVIKEYSSDRG